MGSEREQSRRWGVISPKRFSRVSEKGILEDKVTNF